MEPTEVRARLPRHWDGPLFDVDGLLRLLIDTNLESRRVQKESELVPGLSSEPKDAYQKRMSQKMEAKLATQDDMQQ